LEKSYHEKNLLNENLKATSIIATMAAIVSAATISVVTMLVLFINCAWQAPLCAISKCFAQTFLRFKFFPGFPEANTVQI
jgi:hypothetical protein